MCVRGPAHLCLLLLLPDQAPVPGLIHCTYKTLCLCEGPGVGTRILPCLTDPSCQTDMVT